ncbi:unnamed protein product, partial [Mesorhabditis spiculigera]
METMAGRSLALAELMAEGRIPDDGTSLSALNNNHHPEMSSISLGFLKSFSAGPESGQISHASSLESLDSSPGSLLNHMGSQEPDDGSTSCSEDSFEMSSTCSTRDTPGHSPQREGTSSSFTSGGSEYKLDPESSVAPSREGSSGRDSVVGTLPSTSSLLLLRRPPSTSISMDSFLLKDRITNLRESVDELDTNMPTLDFDRLEKQLQSAAKEREDSERRWLGEEVRKRLATQIDTYSSPSPMLTNRHNRPIGMRLQTGMNLQVCYINELSETSEAASSSESDEESRMSKSRSVPCLKSKAKREDPIVNELRRRAGEGQKLDPAERQRLLNAETNVVLAKSKEAGAKTLEDYRRTKSRACEIPRQSRQLLSRLSTSEIQEILDKIQNAIATKNHQLVSLLIERDTLHMEHDSLLVDIEDFQEHEADAPALDFQKLLKSQENLGKEPIMQELPERRSQNGNVISPPSPAPPSRPKSLHTQTDNRLTSFGSFENLFLIDPLEQKSRILLNGTEKVDVAFVVLVRDRHNITEYEFAQMTVKCYAESRGIPYFLVDETPENREGCEMEDQMYRRHCILANVMAATNHKWFVMFDADMGIINPRQKIDRFIPKDASTFLVLTNRVMNSEIMTGSYIVRNDKRGRGFLNFWASGDTNYTGLVGSDNAAVHSTLIRKYLPHLEADLKKCETWWRSATAFCRLFLYEVCVRDLLDQHEIPGIQFLPKTYSYVRDGWLTNGKFSEDDFVFHNWKNSVKNNRKAFGAWEFQFDDSAFNDLSWCNDSQSAGELWRYKDGFAVGKDVIRKRLDVWIKNTGTERKRQTRQYQTFNASASIVKNCK